MIKLLLVWSTESRILRSMNPIKVLGLWKVTKVLILRVFFLNVGIRLEGLCYLSSLSSGVSPSTFWDKSVRQQAESQWTVAAKLLCHLQYPAMVQALGS